MPLLQIQPRPAASPEQNRLLAALSPAAQQRIFPFLEPCPLMLSEVLNEAGAEPQHAWFPTDSIVSLLCIMENGASAEMALIGNEGLVGITLVMGGGSTPSRATVQSAGMSFRLPGRILKEAFDLDAGLQGLMLRYAHAQFIQTAQTVGCNRHHSVDQHLCRWLLQSLDRIPGNQLSMTQELIANMLGVRREGVTQAAGRLQHCGAIKYSRGQITVLDRLQLETMCCECYQVVRQECDRLLPRHPHDN